MRFFMRVISKILGRPRSFRTPENLRSLRQRVLRSSIAATFCTKTISCFTDVRLQSETNRIETLSSWHGNLSEIRDRWTPCLNFSRLFRVLTLLQVPGGFCCTCWNNINFSIFTLAAAMPIKNGNVSEVGDRWTVFLNLLGVVLLQCEANI